ncbi:alpha-xylosidase [Lachnospiraceae bacterium KM106-2]|nr:alpha-xylosidase [Lachnospiraceae bacterium KM106-2]
MYFTIQDGKLIARKQNETLVVEAWGKNALRVRSTMYPAIFDQDWALEKVEEQSAKIELKDGNAEVKNGKLTMTINHAGVIAFYKEGKLLFREYHRNYDSLHTGESRCLKINGREYTPIIGGDYGLTVRFENDPEERLFGMGQYQQKFMNLKGCILELAQRNSQVSIPFAVSSLGYGFLWNNPAVGKVTFGKNYTEWTAQATKQMDYWVTADNTPADIVFNYTGVTGRAPMLSKDLLGLWQCKLRYRTQEEVLQVARKYKELGIPLDVIVIDFFHWTRQGDWQFDKEYWPDPKAMTEELHAMGTKVVVSVWPSVDKKSIHFNEMSERGFLVRTEHGANQTYDFNGDCLTFDATNPEARAYVWEICKKNYYDLGIDMFWLDNSEPDYTVYDYSNYRYYLGPAVEVSNIYPKLYTDTFYQGMRDTNGSEVPSLVRSAWAGSQRNATIVWSGDVPSTFESFRDQLVAGLNIGLAGIPWWTTDIGGFMDGDGSKKEFVELLLRWYEFAVFTPFLRMHGDREPHNIPPLSELDYGGGYLFTGQPNELWSYGEEAFQIMKDNLKLRLELKTYIESLMKEAHETGAPLMRTMFYEFPEDQKCWTLEDQYMFGSEYLVAPILQLDQRNREVYLPKGTWRDLHTNKKYEGETTIQVDAPLERIPVFEKVK